MDYVCTVVGNLYIKDLHLDLSYMEIVDLSPDDFKSTPQLRDCLRNHQIEVYIQSKYPLAKKFRNRNTPTVKIIEVEKETKSISNSDDISGISKDLSEVSKRLSKALDKIDLLIDSFQNYEIKIKYEENPAINNLLIKMDTLIDVISKNQDNQKFDMILNKFDTFLSKNSSNNFIMRENIVEQSNSFTRAADVPMYVPDLNLDSVSKKSIKAQELSSEGTDDILEKLKKMKKKETSL